MHITRDPTFQAHLSIYCCGLYARKYNMLCTALIGGKAATMLWVTWE